MTITHLKLDNWRNWRHLDTPVGMLTAVVPARPEAAPNNIGKTNVLRALRWVMLNDAPPLEEILLPGASEVVVAATLSSGVTVTRIRSAKRNAYEITSPIGEVTLFEAVGKGPVPEVLRAFGIMDLPEMSPHFQGTAYPSVLDLRPKDFAALLGRLSGATVLEEAAGAARQKATAARSEARSALALVERLQETVNALSVADRIADLGTSLRDALGRGTVALEQFRKSQAVLQDLQEAGPTATLLRIAGEVGPLTRELQEKEGRLGELEGTLKRALAVERELGSARAATEVADKELADWFEAQGVCPLCGGSLDGR